MLPFLRNLCQNLEDHPGARVLSTPTCMKRASVAAILRVKRGRRVKDDDGWDIVWKEGTEGITVKDIMEEEWVKSCTDVEVFHIRRALNPGDIWSGHMAFPGGRVDKGETDLEAAVRETMEEVGIDLTKGFICLGSLDDRKVRNPTGKWALTLCCYVASVHWTSISAFLPPIHATSTLPQRPPLRWSPIIYPVAFLNAPTRTRRSTTSISLRRALQPIANVIIGRVAFYGVVMPMNVEVEVEDGEEWEEAAEEIKVVMVGRRRRKKREEFSIAESSRLVLWGLTLWMTSDLVDLMHGGEVGVAPRRLWQIRPPRFTHLDMHLTYSLLTISPIQFFIDHGLLPPNRKPFIPPPKSSSIQRSPRSILTLLMRLLKGVSLEHHTASLFVVAVGVAVRAVGVAVLVGWLRRRRMWFLGFN
ncbi:hypothetical protein BC829DRAFT_397337 [Chytridium lagenaria]|nr:hypothetical protein BC829DRAFT_397337 [Chytridium lagenaria]